MLLTTVNDSLESTLKELEEKIPALEKAEATYYGKYNRYILGSQLKTQGDRESETKMRLEDEGFTEPYRMLRTAVRILLTRKEVLIEMGRNIRSLGKQSDLLTN